MSTNADAQGHEFRPETILAADFGTATTRVSLFDVVEGMFRYVASGEAPSTLTPPYSDASEGLRHALLELQGVTGRTMLSDAARLIIPVSDAGHGCDVFVATSSAGPAARAVLVGLLPEVSLRSARRLAESSYVSVVETLGLADRRRREEQMDALLKARPDLVILAGGTDGGAAAATLELAETVGLACLRLPAEGRLRVLFVGNSALKEKITDLLGNVASVTSGANVRPGLDREVMDGPRAELAQVLDDWRAAQVGGLRELAQAAGGQILPTAQAEAQIIRFLSKTAESSNGILSVNVGSASTSIAAAFGGELFLTVAPDLGLGVNAQNTLASAPLDQFLRWVPGNLTEQDAWAFALERSLFPHTLPMEADDLHREQALARLAIRGALRRARAAWPQALPGPRADLLPTCDLIIGGGAVLGHAPNPGAAALLLLDALQPTGLTTLALDQNHLLAALGAAAYVNPMAAVQALESGALLRLGVVVSAIGPAREDEVVCTARLKSGEGQETTATVKAGSVEVLPLPLGQQGTLTLKPRSGVDLGFGPGRGQTLELDNGGAVGVIIDARGRPLAFPRDPARRAELVQQWIWKLTSA
jgi:uncharacterized protein (TIGR01319 family)